ncbi:MAG: site-specific integrase [Bacteroidia bacterium]|nr:site-specific integrase [Bacteroidia bacterium]
MAVKVKLRKKSISGNRSSLYLDFYPPIPDQETGEPTRRKFLGLYLFENPKKDSDKNHNKETSEIAEKIRQKMDNQLNKPEIYTVYEEERLNQQAQLERSFIDYFKELADQRKTSNHDNWMSCYNYLLNFTKGKCTFKQVDEKFCNDFSRYLLNAKSLRSDKTSLNQNSAVSYFNKFRATLNQAFREGIIKEDIIGKVPTIKPTETKRGYLTQEELNRLAKTKCPSNTLRNAALFSALTGLRYSDIVKLKWGEIDYNEEDGYVIDYKQQKTQSEEYLPISDQAFELCGYRQGKDDLVFKGLNNRDRYYFFPLWLAAAGIDKELTFHCLRHTFATLQISNDTNLYTVSKLLGHKDLKTTQIYAKIVDKTKREAANKIKIKM